MDHHCPWVGNCIGFHNHKYFMCLIIWSTITLFFLLITYAEVVEKVVFNLNEENLWFIYIVALNYTLIITLFIIIGLFTALHLL